MLGPEIIAAILGPVLGGALSLSLWLNKKNTEHIEKGFEKIGGDVQRVERQVADMRVDIAKNYVTNEDLVAHIQGEENWHASINSQVDDIKTDIRDIRNNLHK